MGRSGIECEYLGCDELEDLTGLPASTWRYWATVDKGPASVKLGRRRLWRKSTVMAWLAEQELIARAR